MYLLLYSGCVLQKKNCVRVREKGRERAGELKEIHAMHCHRTVNACVVMMGLPMPAFVFKGIIRTALPNMNRENREQYQVVIQAKDMGGQMGGLSGTTTVNITLTDVNDNPPRFPQSKLSLIALLHYKSIRMKELGNRHLV